MATGGLRLFARRDGQGGVRRVLEKTITGTEEKAREAEEGARDGQGEAGRVVGKLAGLYACTQV